MNVDENTSSSSERASKIESSDTNLVDDSDENKKSAAKSSRSTKKSSEKKSLNDGDSSPRRKKKSAAENENASASMNSSEKNDEAESADKPKDDIPSPHPEPVPQNTQAQSDAESSPADDAFIMPLKKLTRRRGTRVSLKRIEPVPAEERDESDNSKASGPGSFVAHTIELPRRTYFVQLLGEYSDDCLEWKASRRRGKLYSKKQLDERAAKTDGTIHAVFEDRAPVLRMNILPLKQMFYERISLKQRRDIVDYLELRHDEFNHKLREFARTNLVLNWYDFIPPSRTVPESSDDDTPSEAEEVGTDLAAAAIFEIFEQPLERFFFEETDPAELYRIYCTHHAGRITSLLCDWALSLPYIDRGVFGGPANTPLSICFVDRFRQILTADFEAAHDQNVTLPDMEIMERFDLDDVDLLLLWIMAGHEMDYNFKNAVRTTWDQQSIIYMNTGTLMRYFCRAAEERADVMRRLSPSSVMASSGLFKLIQGSVPTQPLSFEIVVSEQIVRLFYGIRSLSVASTQYAELLFPHLAEDTFVSKEHEKTFRIIQNYLERPPLNAQPNLERNNLNFIPSMAFQIEGLPGSGRTTLVKLMASRFKKPLIIVQTSPLVGIHPTDCEEYLKHLFNDAALMNAFVAFREAGPILTEERLAAVFARHLSRHPVVCAFCVDLAVKTHPVIDPYLTFKTKMDANLKDTASAFWHQHLMLPLLKSEHVNLKALSQRLALQPFQIQKATKLAYYSTDADEKNDIELSNNSLEKAAAVQVTKNIGNLAFVSDPEIDLSDVIVSDDIMDKIKRIIGSAQNRRRVLYEWGLSKRIRRGTGVIALFDGEPGTGKTHSAEAIAHELGLSLMRINIATMVDKYVGETEKNLTTIFEQARPDMQLLLFDEADSLFTKRTANVSKSNDRYSNMSVNVLLQLVERYEGVSILTTNLKNAIDPAFERRITYKVYFPMPKKAERERLWRYMCPPEILTAEPIDYEWLSELEMSGGEIKNSVLTAAFTAATNGVLLNSEILYNAGVMEASAAGRVLRRYEEGDDFSEY